MYSELWSPSLRQGDVLGPLYVPMVGNKQTVISSLVGPGGGVGDEVEQMLFPAKSRYVTVVSHDCEFNEGKRDRLLVARMQNTPRDDPELVEKLRQSNDVEARHAAKEQVDGVDNFLFEPLEGAFEYPYVAVFSTIIPFPAADVVGYQRIKKAELTHEHRLLFRTKLAWYFVRGPEDVPEDEKKPPEEVLGALNGDEN